MHSYNSKDQPGCPCGGNCREIGSDAIKIAGMVVDAAGIFSTMKRRDESEHLATIGEAAAAIIASTYESIRASHGYEDADQWMSFIFSSLQDGMKATLGLNFTFTYARREDAPAQPKKKGGKS